MMNMVQISLFQIDNYGPWTVKQGFDREAKLQILQSELYSEIQKRLSKKGGIAFFSRFDNILGVTNGIDEKTHLKIQNEINSLYPITISIGVGRADVPYEAQRLASEVLQRYGSSQSHKRKAVFGIQGKDEGKVQIAHIDINGSTQNITDTISAYSALCVINETYLLLSKLFLKNGGLTFFLGGDNFLVISNNLSSQDFSKIADIVYKELLVELRIGVGTGYMPKDALISANKSLEKIRKKF